NRLPRILGGEKFGPCGLRGATQLAEEIQLKCGVGGQVQKVELRLKVAFFSPGEIAVPLYLRKQTGTRDRNLRASLIDALGGKLQIVVLLLRDANQFLDLG